MVSAAPKASQILPPAPLPLHISLHNWCRYLSVLTLDAALRILNLFVPRVLTYSWRRDSSCVRAFVRERGWEGGVGGLGTEIWDVWGICLSTKWDRDGDLGALGELYLHLIRLSLCARACVCACVCVCV